MDASNAAEFIRNDFEDDDDDYFRRAILERMEALDVGEEFGVEGFEIEDFAAWLNGVNSSRASSPILPLPPPSPVMIYTGDGVS